jgi:ferritin-like metal-binding protein YciE
MNRIKEDGIVEKLSAEEKEKLAQHAGSKRAENKEVKAASVTRKKAVANAAERLQAIFEEVGTHSTRVSTPSCVKLYRIASVLEPASWHRICSLRDAW